MIKQETSTKSRVIFDKDMTEEEMADVIVELAVAAGIVKDGGEGHGE